MLELSEPVVHTRLKAIRSSLPARFVQLSFECLVDIQSKSQKVDFGMVMECNGTPRCVLGSMQQIKLWCFLGGLPFGLQAERSLCVLYQGILQDGLIPHCHQMRSFGLSSIFRAV